MDAQRSVRIGSRSGIGTRLRGLTQHPDVVFLVCAAHDIRLAAQISLRSQQWRRMSVSLRDDPSCDVEEACDRCLDTGNYRVDLEK